MAQAHELRSFDYVNHRYGEVASALRERASEIFARATNAAAGRAKALATTLRIEIAGLEVGADIALVVEKIEERGKGPSETPSMRMHLVWRAVRSPALFPSMEADLEVYPLSADETQLDLHGVYRAPFGVLGSTVDTLIGHRVAEASVRRFVEDLARYLREHLTGAPEEAHAQRH